MTGDAANTREPLAGGRAFQLSLAGFGLASALLVVTFIPGAPMLPFWLMFALVGGAVFVGVFRIAGRRGVWTRTIQISKDDALKNIPAGLRLPIQAFTVAMFAIAAVAFIHLTGGQGEVIHGRYYLDDHGSFTPVTRAVYEQSRIWEGRLFTAMPAVAFLASACVNYTP
jgi:hypothetical protein